MAAILGRVRTTRIGLAVDSARGLPVGLTERRDTPGPADRGAIDAVTRPAASRQTRDLFLQKP